MNVVPRASARAGHAGAVGAVGRCPGRARRHQERPVLSGAIPAGPHEPEAAAHSTMAIHRIDGRNAPHRPKVPPSVHSRGDYGARDQTPPSDAASTRPLATAASSAAWSRSVWSA